jgi:hypothetical protein
MTWARKQLPKTFTWLCWLALALPLHLKRCNPQLRYLGLFSRPHVCGDRRATRTPGYDLGCLGCTNGFSPVVTTRASPDITGARLALRFPHTVTEGTRALPGIPGWHTGEHRSGIPVRTGILAWTGQAWDWGARDIRWGTPGHNLWISHPGPWEPWGGLSFVCLQSKVLGYLTSPGARAVLWHTSAPRVPPWIRLLEQRAPCTVLPGVHKAVLEHYAACSAAAAGVALAAVRVDFFAAKGSASDC